MSRIFLYAHGGSGNHGCEAIVRSTIKLLGIRPVLISSSPEEDRRYGLHEYCDIIQDVDNHFRKFSPDFVKAYINLKIHKDYVPMDKIRYKKSFSRTKKDDIALSIGGDNYCYADVHKYIMLHDILKERGVKTVLWGCSVEPAVARRTEIATDLKRYDLITTRESITYSVLKNLNPNTLLFPDPAFYLDSKETSLSYEFKENNTVGINLSPMIIENEKIPGMTIKNYEKLVDAILSETEMNIAFIPHVVWAKGDDRRPLLELYERYKDSNRCLLVEDQDCERLKYIISKCRFFIGARTHATIAAYSTCVPTLVVGYSVKARGIARDLFGSEEEFSTSVQKLDTEDQLLQYFRNLYKRETEVKKILIEKKSLFRNQMNLIRKSFADIVGYL